jgi:hypothetical protein
MEEPIQFGDPHILNAGIPLEFQKACNDVFHNPTSLPAANAYAPFPASPKRSAEQAADYALLAGNVLRA